MGIISPPVLPGACEFKATYADTSYVNARALLGGWVGDMGGMERGGDAAGMHTGASFVSDRSEGDPPLVHALGDGRSVLRGRGGGGADAGPCQGVPLHAAMKGHREVLLSGGQPLIASPTSTLDPNHLPLPHTHRDTLFPAVAEYAPCLEQLHPAIQVWLQL